ncbi:hypothetical protein [Streptomyces sp. SAJ15]|uniref:hypothetical protein n=1 Tax=Streptomyces sp. SAJ15 TaxID=2011095 RepID=UPI0011870889|nr:hypothetical protein [Streptomyces sp. SAJ15]TVL92133.1 hypothetical protein CD790_10315 [Streptomyces sp. SAJ15]
MSITQQHILDVYRSTQRGEPAPPAPGTADRRLVRPRSPLARTLTAWRAALTRRPRTVAGHETCS